MYLRVKRVSRGRRSYEYLQIVEGARREGKVRQRVVATLGRLDQLKASGQLDRLAGAFARHDPPPAGIRREVGPLLVVRHVIERLGIVEIVSECIPPRSRAQLSVGEVIVALIANRLAAPAPLYDIAGWGSQAAIQELFAIPGMLLNDDRLGRALEDFHRVCEQVRGSVTLRAVERFGVEAGRLHLDLTGLRFEGAYEDSSFVAKGWQAGGKVTRQVKALTATNSEGVPLYVRPHAGDAAELVCIGAALERLVELLPPGLVICADSAFGHPRNLCEAARAGVRFVVPLRQDSGFVQRFASEVGHEALRPIRYVSRRQHRLPSARRARYRGALRPFPITDPQTGETHRFRVAYIYSSEEAASVAEGRERALTKADEALGRVKRGLGGRYYKSKKQVDDKIAQILIPSVKDLLKVTTGTAKGKPTLLFERDAAAIAEAAGTDGIYALATNLPGRRLTAGQLLRIYKNQSLIECAHRNAKGSLRVRPVFLHNDDRIEALVSVVGLALVVFGLIESEVRKALGENEQLAGLLPEGRSARPTGRNILACFQGLGITYTPDGIVVDRLTTTQRRVLELLEVAIPWPEQTK
ncbi:MAG: IS1634 family transposase [Candidatus Methylomirabilales bacterium]